eukprot:TRINITY_DN17278_c0_g1_i1.p1 TRINITY_DN17278_c0_g1~~TRINITY_DN17278_c0_g1_i1.p1  ORF type:complete len:241 (+),score=68.53 TRINITY_DN17278_c0_g1_i1:29-724(+)
MASNTEKKMEVICFSAVSVDGRMDHLPESCIPLYYSICATTWPQVNAVLSTPDTLKAFNTNHENPPPLVPQPPRDPGDKRQLLVVNDSKGRLDCWSSILGQPYFSHVVLLCTKSTPESYIKYVTEKCNIPVIFAGDSHVDLKEAFAQLRQKYQVTSIRADCGGTFNGVLLRQGLVTSVNMLLLPNLVGGSTHSSLFKAPDLKGDAGIIKLKLKDVSKQEGDTLLIQYTVDQ